MILSRVVVHDISLTFAQTLTLASFYCVFTSDGPARKRWLLLFYGAAALAVVKGDVPSDRVEVFVPLRGHVDFAQETKRLARELEKVNKESTAVQKKLANPEFLKKAPEEVVKKERLKLEGLTGKKTKIEAGLERIKGLIGQG